jgi:hypothetical protein
MRYSLIVIIFALIGMYFLVLGNPFPTWLPAPTQKEIQECNQRGLRNLAARADADAIHRLNENARALATRTHQPYTEEASTAYTSCDTPLGGNLADLDSDF